MDELYQSDEDEVDLPEVSLGQSERQAGSRKHKKTPQRRLFTTVRINVITIEQSEDEVDVEESIFTRARKRAG